MFFNSKRRFNNTFAAFALATTTLIAPATMAEDGLAKVYAYNGGADNAGTSDGYNSGAQGWVWSEMGLLGPDGEVPTVNGSDELVLEDGTVVGSVVRGPDVGEPPVPGPIIGYENANGKMRCYNIDTDATFKDAWEAVDANGDLILAKHGVRYVNAGGDTVGHGTTLDDGDNFPGFKPEGGTGTGTGAGGDPYELPGRPGASIGVYLNTCYSCDDADGAGDQKKSATDSIKEVPGVDDDNVTGNEGIIYKGPTLTGLSPAEVAALEACAKAAGHTKKNADGDTVGDIGGWATSLPFPSMRNTLKQCMIDAGIADPSFGVTWVKSNVSCEDAPGAISCPYYNPVTAVGPEGAFLEFFPTLDHYPAHAMIPPGFFPEPEALFFNAVTPEMKFLDLLPPDQIPATYFMDLRRYDNQPFFQPEPIQLMLQFDPGTPIAGVFRLDEFGPQFIPAFVDETEGVIFIQVHEPGIYFGLGIIEPAPLPGDVNGDGLVNVFDLLEVLGNWGPCDECDADLNGDGMVDVQDLLEVLANWTGG